MISTYGLHRLASARVSCYQVEQQLYSRQVPFQHAWGKAEPAVCPAPLSIQYPILLLRLADLMPYAAPFAHALVAAFLTTDSKSKAFAVRNPTLISQYVC